MPFLPNNNSLKIDYDYFIRTTLENHWDVVKLSIQRALPDIYLGKYVGWYNMREEYYLSEQEAKQY